MMMNLAIRISSLEAGLIAAGGGPERPMPGDKIEDAVPTCAPSGAVRL
jgi:hypothetical protein